MKILGISVTGTELEISVEVPGSEIRFAPYIGSCGATVADNAQVAHLDTYSGGPFIVNFRLRPDAAGVYVVRPEIRHPVPDFLSSLPKETRLLTVTPSGS